MFHFTNILKSEIWFTKYCLRFGNKTIVYAVCFAVFLIKCLLQAETQKTIGLKKCHDKFYSNGANRSCPVGRISVNFKNHGRTSPYSEVCPYDAAYDEDLNCYTDPTKLDVVNRLCQGEQSCHVTYAEISPGDPCNGTYKYFEARYQCNTHGM